MVPIEFLRQFRLGEYAIFDFGVTFLGMYLLAPWLSKGFRKIGIDIPKKLSKISHPDKTFKFQAKNDLEVETYRDKLRLKRSFVAEI